MNKRYPILLSGILICLLFVTSCNKRDTYLGNYNCNFQQNCWGNVTPCPLADGGQTVIVVQAGSRENTITIFGREIEIDALNRGSYGSFEVSGFDVSFNNDIITVYEHYAPAYGGYTRTYIGAKSQ